MSHGWPRESSFRMLEHRLGRCPAREQLAAAPVLGDEPEDVEVGERLARRARDLLDQADAPLGVDERAFLLAPAGGGQHEVGELRGLGGVRTCPARPGSRACRAVSCTSFWLIHECAGLVAITHRPLILPRADALDDLVVGQARRGRGCAPRRCRGCRATFARCSAFVKSWPPSRLVVLLNSREPIALHWPVIEFAPVPGRPMLPVISARLMIACAVRTPSWPWFTPIVHQNETRLPSWIVSREAREIARLRCRSRRRRASGVNGATMRGELLEAGRVRVDERRGRSSRARSACCARP